MASLRYAHPPRARDAAVGLDTPWPAAFLAAQLNQSLYDGLPARHRLGPLKAAVARRGLPERLLARALRVPGRRPRPDLDRLVAEVRERWPERGDLSALAVRRSAGLTVFLFADGPAPAFVLKVPAPDDDRVDREVAALEAVTSTGMAPRYLGRVGDARVQEGLPGRSLRVLPVTLETAGDLAWDPRLRDLADAFIALGRVTATPAWPDEVHGPLLDAAAASHPEARDAVSRLASLDVSVLKHSDTSAQNCLFQGDRLSGVVDWEMATPHGAPGFDILNAALSAFEHGLGLRRWKEPLVVEAFAAAWRRAPYFRAARAAAAEAARAVGVDDHEVHAALRVAYFARRLGRRLAEPGRFATGPVTAARMLEITCAP